MTDATPKYTRWTADECPDAGDGITIRPYDGSPNGDTEAAEIATVYDPANAPLIAAAPALLEALKRLRDCPALMLDGQEPEDVAAIEAASDAIAAAEGRTP